MADHAAFTRLGEHEIPDYNGTGILFRHDQTGAEVFHLSNDDPENVFAFVFPTYPSDSTGVAHILEHTVLSGSEQFPVKDPFLQLLKGSVNTFLNAMTFPDKTVYPAASPVKQDVFNMMTVYGDAVFFPLLKPELFRQEGHRLQFDEDGALERTGIVYNEMKGNYSSHDSVVGEACYQSLFPDTIYGFDSGGNPAVIPELTYDQFVAFHRRYYHPANARITLYGNIPSEDYLAFLHERFLSRFASTERVAPPELQPRWAQPRRLETTYPLDGVEDTSARSSVTLNWLLFPVNNARRVLDASVLSEILLGHSGSPLARALLESGLGQDLSPVMGLETDLREAIFSVGLRGTEVDHEEQIRSLILDTLSGLVENGLDPDAVEGALRRVEFHNRELKGGPNGLRMMRRALRSWMYDDSPFDPLLFAKHMRSLREELQTRPRMFEEMIRELFIDNQHRSTVVVRPDPGQTEREARELQAELSQIAVVMDKSDRERIDREVEELKALQNAPDDPQALAKIPFLRLDDIPREIQTIDYETTALEGSAGEVYLHREFTNGIAYLDLAFDFGRLTERQELLLSLLTSAFTEVGLPGMPHHRLNDEINLRTGGMSASTTHQTRYRDLGRMRRMLVLRVRALDRSWREGFGLFERVIRELDFSDRRKLEQLIDELVQEMQSEVIPHGHHFSGLRAGAGAHELLALEERRNGVTQLEFLRALMAEMDAEPAGQNGIGRELCDLFTQLIDPAALNINVTADDATADEIHEWLPELVGAVRERFRGDSSAEHYGGVAIAPYDEWSPREFLSASAAVSYVAHVIPGISVEDPRSSAQDALAHLLRTGPLWEKIRMQGGAYGAFASSRPTEALFSFGSYRDPNTVRTLEAYREALAEIAAHPPEEGQLELAKVSMLGRELRPMSPRERGFVNFRRRLHDIDDPLRRELRDRLRAVTPEQVGEVAGILLDRMSRGRTVILGGASALEEWRDRLTGEYGAAEVSVTSLGV